jgi:hypothetical protein
MGPGFGFGLGWVGFVYGIAFVPTSQGERGRGDRRLGWVAAEGLLVLVFRLSAPGGGRPGYIGRPLLLFIYPLE